MRIPILSKWLEHRALLAGLAYELHRLKDGIEQNRKTGCQLDRLHHKHGIALRRQDQLLGIALCEQGKINVATAKAVETVHSSLNGHIAYFDAVRDSHGKTLWKNKKGVGELFKRMNAVEERRCLDDMIKRQCLKAVEAERKPGKVSDDVDVVK